MAQGHTDRVHFDGLTLLVEDAPVNEKRNRELRTSVLVLGGGLGGVSATLAAASLGARVILAEELDWLGGQLTAQGVPLDESPFVETLVSSRTYSDFRARIRDYYRRNYPLTPQARLRSPFNPGMGNVGTLCHEPRVSVQVIDEMLAPYTSSGRVRVLRRHKLVRAHTDADKVTGLTMRNLDADEELFIGADLIIDATETGELLESAGVEHVFGAEAQSATGELHAIAGPADPFDQQAITWAFAADYFPGEDHTIDKPERYDFWRSIRLDFWPGPQFGWLVSDHVTHQHRMRPLFAGDTDEEYLFDLWHARRIAYRRNFAPGTYASDITLACWPQMEYWHRPTVGVTPEEAARALEEARDLTRSFVYWVQTEAPRHDGGTGYRGLHLRGDVLGTPDGLAKQAYYREGRRIKAEFTLLEEHIGFEARAGLTGAERFHDSVGVGAYRIDLHPSTRGRNTIDIDTCPFQIPLGSLLPVRVDNLLPACKNLGTTRITSGACRVHPIEWSIGEASGALASFVLQRNTSPRAVRSNPAQLADFQRLLSDIGVMLAWPSYGVLTASSRTGYRAAT